MIRYRHETFFIRLNEKGREMFGQEMGEERGLVTEGGEFAIHQDEVSAMINVTHLGSGYRLHAWPNLRAALAFVEILMSRADPHLWRGREVHKSLFKVFEDAKGEVLRALR
jgi:hypothetical protein